MGTSGGFLQEPMLQFPEGARIKQNIGNALTTTYPRGNYSGIFDGIDEKTVWRRPGRPQICKERNKTVL